MSVTLAEQAAALQAREIAALDPPAQIAINQLDLAVVRLDLKHLWCEGVGVADLDLGTVYHCRLCIKPGSTKPYRFDNRDWIHFRVRLVGKQEAKFCIEWPGHHERDSYAKFHTACLRPDQRWFDISLAMTERRLTALSHIAQMRELSIEALIQEALDSITSPLLLKHDGL